ncbi:DUF4007 family protein [Chloroflexales bacterium ZM16-3]|nr:DUF4007 family protein [Chloroflexales bacterium ZM16-3]
MTTLQSPPTFSGHETFALRGGWLKKAFDLLADYPDLFVRDDAFVRLGVGKNMAASIRFWGRVCGVFARDAEGNHQPTELGRALLADDGWDPYLVTPAARWLLHWYVAARPEAAFTWFYTFNLLRSGECSPAPLAAEIQAYVRERGGKVPSDATIKRDVECLLHTYAAPDARRLASGIEDALSCPLSSLGLLRHSPGQRSYYLASGSQPSVPDPLVAWATLAFVRERGQSTAAFNDLAYSPGSPGRVFRFDADGLLSRMLSLSDLTSGQLVYNDQAGIRQVYWSGGDGDALAATLLRRSFEDI